MSDERGGRGVEGVERGRNGGLGGSHKGDVGKTSVGGGQGSGSRPCSFHDKVLGGKGGSFEHLEGDLLQQKLAKIVFEEGNVQRPMVCFEERVIDVISPPWKEALVIKLLGKHISYTAMREKIRGLWRLKGGYEVMDVGFGYFMLKFDLQEDREKVIVGGPWMLHDHYLAVKEWSPSFNPCEESFGRMMVWIKFSGLNMMYFEESVIRTVAAAVGKPVKVDLVTKSMDRGRFARVCVEVDLSKPVIDEVWIYDHWHKVEFECLHLICSDCRCFGHVTRNCSKSNAMTAEAAEVLNSPKQSSVVDPVVQQPENPSDTIQSNPAISGENHGAVTDTNQFMVEKEGVSNEEWTEVRRKSRTAMKRNVGPAKSNLKLGSKKVSKGTLPKLNPHVARDKGKQPHVTLHGPKMDMNLGETSGSTCNNKMMPSTN